MTTGKQKDMEKNQIVIYQTEDGQTQIDVRMENDMAYPSADCHII